MEHKLPRDPWQKVRTNHDFPADELIAALQKEIRRGVAENAAIVAYELASTSQELEAKVWQRLLTIAVEDIGMGDPQAPVLVNALFQMHNEFMYGEGDRYLYIVHAVRYLCACQKDRSSDEMLNWIITGVNDGTVKPEIPDYAVDMHTLRGQQMGRGIEHFLNEAARVEPELENRDRTYYDRLMVLLKKQ